MSVIQLSHTTAMSDIPNVCSKWKKANLQCTAVSYCKFLLAYYGGQMSTKNQDSHSKKDHSMSNH